MAKRKAARKRTTRTPKTRPGPRRTAQRRVASGEADPRLVVERVQTGVRIEKRILKVLKAFAELHDITLGDLLEGIVLHSFEGKCPFQKESLHKISELKKIYELDLTSSMSHQLRER